MDSRRDSRISGGNFREVYLLVTPLQCYYTYNFSKVDLYAARKQNKRIPFRRLQHWAIQVGDDDHGEMYEVTSYGSTEGTRRLNLTSAKEWREGRKGRPRRKLFITVTERSTSELKNIAQSVWDAVLEDEYRAMSRNCQSFAELFKGIIEDPELLTEEKSTELDDMPNSFNPFYAVMHLKEAHKATARFITQKVFNRKEKFLKREGVSDDGEIHPHARLPGKRSSRWLEIVNEVSKQHEFGEKADVRGILHQANSQHRTERCPNKPQPKRRLTWT